MSNRSGGHLRLYREQQAEHVDPTQHALHELCTAFEQATGWPLRYVAGPAPRNDAEPIWSAPVDAGIGAPLGHLVFDERSAASLASGTPPADSHAAALAARRLAEQLAAQSNRLVRGERVLREREAELAAGVPVTAGIRSAPHLAERLEAVLRCGAMAIGCHAAGLYMLDEWTTSLKLRAAWHLPAERLAADARLLEAANADLEALAGHAVCIESAAARAAWSMPECFPAAVCVPVSSPTVPLGTLWLYCEHLREFSDEQVNLAEMTAGRLAADLEREMLLAEAQRASAWKWQLAAAQRWQENQQPAIAPLLDGWELAGFTRQAAEVGGDFHDWYTRPDGSLLVAVGHCLLDGFDAALCATLVRGALRAHGQYVAAPDKLLESIHHTLWTSSAGDQFGSLLCASLRSGESTVRWAEAGASLFMLLTDDGARMLAAPSLPLGIEPAASYERMKVDVPPGGVLVAVSRGIDGEGASLEAASLVEAVAGHLAEPAPRLLDRLRPVLEIHESSVDHSVLVIKRRGG